MTISHYTWEQNLYSIALSAISLSGPSEAIAMQSQTALHEAYQYCEQLTARHSRSFYMASRFLLREQRLACRALYAFCRISDDLVDQPDENPQQALDQWRAQALGVHLTTHHPVILAFQDTCCRYQIPIEYAHQLLDGVAVDLQQARYQTFEELTRYCYGVASTVGLMSMHIIGFSSPLALPYAIKLGIALQMTNILRDVAEDWRAGRVYLPQAELAQFDLTTTDLAQGQVTDNWRAFMQFQIERMRRLYEEASPGLAMLDSSGRFAIAAAAELYRAILDDIEMHDYDVFSRRASISKWGKIRRLPSVWWKSANSPSTMNEMVN